MLLNYVLGIPEPNKQIVTDNQGESLNLGVLLVEERAVKRLRVSGRMTIALLT